MIQKKKSIAATKVVAPPVTRLATQTPASALSGADGVNTAQAASRKGVKAGSETVPEAPPRPADVQLKTWNSAVKLFSQRLYAEAAALFHEAAKGPAAHVADKARSYEQICQRQSARPQVEFRTAEDHFYYGVERLNAGDFQKARTHLSQALRLQPEGDHILYAMALCCGVSGDGNGACENLKRAIDLEPKNRVMARQDSDFRSLAQQFPALRALLTAESSGDN